MPRTARDTSENIDRGFSLRAFTRAGAAVAKTYVKYVVLVLVVGQLALATACTQPSGVRYISTQEPALGSEREFVVLTGKNGVENLETELSKKLDVVSQSHARVPELRINDPSKPAIQGEQIVGVSNSPFTLTVPFEEVAANLDDSVLVEVAVGLGVISSSDAEAIVLAARDGSDGAASGSGQATESTVLGFSFGQSSGTGSSPSAASGSAIGSGASSGGGTGSGAAGGSDVGYDSSSDEPPEVTEPVSTPEPTATPTPAEDEFVGADGSDDTPTPDDDESNSESGPGSDDGVSDDDDGESDESTGASSRNTSVDDDVNSGKAPEAPGAPNAPKDPKSDLVDVDVSDDEDSDDTTDDVDEDKGNLGNAPKAPKSDSEDDEASDDEEENPGGGKGPKDSKT